MSGQKLRTVLAANLLWMIFAAPEDLKIEVGPSSKIAAQIGGYTELTCTVTGCESPFFSWRTQIDSPLGGKVQNEGTKSTLIMNPVSLQNEHSYLCTASCGSKKVERGIQVDVYSFPSDPEIEMSGPLIVGSPITVTCKVPKVHPSERLQMAFLMEGSRHPMEAQEMVEDADESTIETKGLKMTFTPTMEDMGKTLTCEAKLPIDEMEFEPKERRTTQRLQVNDVPKNPAISISPSNTVQEGDPVTLTCSSEGLPPPQIFWSKKQDNEDLSPLSENATLTLVATRREDSGTYVCEAKNQFGKSRKEVEITVQ
ncbi:vascular cell adhesion protein 1-like, partial [Gracilinanus agilis]|uniref:vascular cell adhesion protein 1-like n=1 Tax=Gracilinanus agilis TaxID=191870 RepID=UPI001CFD1225